MNRDVKIGLIIGMVMLIVVAVMVVATNDEDDPKDAPRQAVTDRTDVGGSDTASATGASDPTVADTGGDFAGTTDPASTDTSGASDDEFGADATETDRSEDVALVGRPGRVETGDPTISEILAGEVRTNDPTLDVGRGVGESGTGTGRPAPSVTEYGATTTHKVKKGETLSAISQIHYGTTARWKSVLEANREQLNSPRDLRPDMVLFIPGDGRGSAIEKTGGIIEPAPRPVPAPRTTEKTYTVKKGDTLWGIAASQMGSGARHTTLYEANRGRLKMKSPADLRPGMTLVIPTD